MHLSLSDSEIKEAIELYVNTQGISTEGKSVDIKLKSGRNGNGHKAEVSISTPDGSESDGESNSSIFGGGQ